MGWLDNLFGRNTPKTSASTAPTPALQLPSPPSSSTGLPTDPALLSLLGRFIYGANPTEVAHSGWDQALGKPAMEAIGHFHNVGWLIEAPTAVKLGCGYTVAELKPQLKARGLPVSGKKEQLIARLLEADPQGAASLASAHPIWLCSAPAAEAAQAYKEDRAGRQELAHRTAFAALLGGRAQEAVEAIASFERTEVAMRGLGFDWTLRSTTELQEEQVRTILGLSPKILEGLDPQELPQMRALAAMLALTGESRAKRWLETELRGHPMLEFEAAVRMLLFAGTHVRELAQYAKIGIKELRVMHLGEYSCPACRKFGRKVFSLSAAPELPHAGCTHEMGCRCGYEPIIDFG